MPKKKIMAHNPAPMERVLTQGPRESSGKRKSSLVEGLDPRSGVGVTVGMGVRRTILGVREEGVGVAVGVAVTVGVTVTVGVVVIVGVTLVVGVKVGVGVPPTVSLNSMRKLVLLSTFMNAGWLTTSTSTMLYPPSVRVNLNRPFPRVAS